MQAQGEILRPILGEMGEGGGGTILVLRLFESYFIPLLI